jgi:hypothetical protein
MMVTTRYSLSDLASSHNGEDGEDENNEDAEQGKLSKDDKPSWVIGTITKLVEQCMQRFWQRQMKLNELTQLGYDDAADYFREGEKKYATSDLMVLAVVQPQLDDDTMAPALGTFGEHMECVDIVPRKSQMPQGTA